LVSKNIYNAIERSLHLGQACKDRLTYAGESLRDAVGTNNRLDLRSVDGLAGNDRGNSSSALRSVVRRPYSIVI
jgi:hypothetical protein